MRLFESLPIILGVSLVSLGVASCASSTSPNSMVAEVKDPNEVICRNDTNVGSRLPKKTCRTRLEWDEIAEGTQELNRNLQRDTARGAITDGSRK